MTHIFRKYQQGMMIAVTFIIIISFVWFYNRTSMDKLSQSGDTIATIYGRNLSEIQVQRAAGRFQICADLGLFDMLQSLSGSDRQRMYEDFVWNSMVLDHEAEVNQVAPTDEEVTAEIKQLPPFQTEGQFDPQKYGNFVQEKLAPRGFTELQLEEIVRSDLKLRKLKEIIGATVEAAPSELRLAYDVQNQKNKLSLVRLDLALIASSVTISDAELSKAYEQRKSNLNAEEQRQFKLVSLALPSNDKSLQGKSRIDALQKLARQAEEFSQAMLAKGAQFDAVAAKFNLPVEQTSLFPKSKPDPKLGTAPEIVTEAFRISLKDPNSDPIQTENGFIILHLEKVVTARPLTLEEAKPILTEAIKSERSREMLNVKANETRSKIAAAMKSGKSFADAATEAGQKAESFATFTLSELGDVMKQPDAPTIIQKSLELNVGQLSDVVPVSTGAVVISVEERQPVSEEKFQKEKAALTENYTRGKRNIAFREWLRMRREAAKIQITARS